MDDNEVQAAYLACLQHVESVLSNIENWTHQAAVTMPENLSADSKVWLHDLQSRIDRFKSQLSELRLVTEYYDVYHALFVIRSFGMGTPGYAKLIAEEVEQGSLVWDYLRGVSSAADYIGWVANNLMVQMNNTKRGDNL